LSDGALEQFAVPLILGDVGLNVVLRAAMVVEKDRYLKTARAAFQRVIQLFPEIFHVSHGLLLLGQCGG
jgi:hypothetical protein